MEDNRKRLLMGISIILITIVLLGLLLFSLFRPKKTDTNANRSMQVTSFYSPITNSEDKLTVNYGGEANPNRDAVKQPFRIFNIDSLPLSQNARDALRTVIQDALLSVIIPTYPNTYVHVERNSVKCDAGDNCTMHIYLDSPESFFELKLNNTNGVPSYDIQQLPWKGVK